jgi:redox-sensing transcriptional repressor
MMKIPYATLERIATYLRCVKNLQALGVKIISSSDLAKNTRATPEQVRKDLSYFGKFGKTGEGYNLDKLVKKLERILRTKKEWRVCIIGAGSLGSALARYPGFKESGYNIVALFDNNPSKIGKSRGSAKIFDIKNFKEIIETMKIELAILTVPQSAYEDIKELLENSKIKGIINFIPHTLRLKTRRKIPIVNIDLAQKLYILSYLIKNKWEE